MALVVALARAALGRGSPATRHLGFGSTCRSLAVAAGSEVQERLASLKNAMAEAVESAETVGPSAATLLLETDPAERGPRESYDLHYAELALGQLHSALDMHTNLQHLLEHTFGVEEAERLLKANTLMVAAADCQLWRDRMEQLVSSVRRRQQANEVLPCD